MGPLDVAGTAVQALAHLRSWAGKTRRQAHGAAATTARTVERQIARLALSDVPSNPCICGRPAVLARRRAHLPYSCGMS